MSSVSVVEEGKVTSILEAEVDSIPVSSVRAQVEMLSAKVSDLTSKLDGLEASFEAIARLIDEIAARTAGVDEVVKVATVIGEWKRLTCRYHREGVCMAWRVTGEKGIKYVEVDGVKRPNVALQPVFCAFCPLYEPRRSRG